MSVLPFPTGHDVDDVDDVDDTDESTNRYGTLDATNGVAHRVVNASLLTAITGFAPIPCQEFHHVFFALLEDVGDFDGLIATPVGCIGRRAALAAAHAWIATHPAIDGGGVLATADEESGDDAWQRTIAQIEAHSMALAEAVGTNPSLTFGSVEAVSERLADDVLEIALSCLPEQVTTLTRVALDLVARLPESVRVVGGAARSTTLVGDPYDGWRS